MAVRERRSGHRDCGAILRLSAENRQRPAEHIAVTNEHSSQRRTGGGVSEAEQFDNNFDIQSTVGVDTESPLTGYGSQPIYCFGDAFDLGPGLHSILPKIPFTPQLPRPAAEHKIAFAQRPIALPQRPVQKCRHLPPRDIAVRAEHVIYRRVAATRHTCGGELVNAGLEDAAIIVGGRTGITASRVKVSFHQDRSNPFTPEPIVSRRVMHRVHRDNAAATVARSTSRGMRAQHRNRHR